MTLRTIRDLLPRRALNKLTLGQRLLQFAFKLCSAK